MKNIAFLYREYHENKLALENDTNAMQIVLGSNIWETPIVDDIRSLTQFETDLKTFENDTIDTLLFYYTAHGDLNKDQTDLYFRFHTEKNRNIDNVIDVIEEIFETRKPKKLIFIIDACYSRKALSKISAKCSEKTYNYEILVSSASDEKSSINASANISKFTSEIQAYYQSNALEGSLQNIAEQIEESNPLYESHGSSSTVLYRNENYQSMISKILQEVNTQSIDVDSFKKVALSYLPSTRFDIDYATFHTLELLLKRIVSRNYFCQLYAILKDLEIDTHSIEQLCPKKDAKTYDIWVKDIIIVISRATSGYLLSLYTYSENYIYEGFKLNIDSAKDKIEEGIIAILSELKSNTILTADSNKILFIIPNELFVDVDFKVLELDEDTLYEEFTLLTAFYDRLKDYDNDDKVPYIRRWRNLLDDYENNQTLRIQDRLFTNHTRIKSFHDSQNFFFVSNRCMLLAKPIGKILNNGIPFVLTPQHGDKEINTLCTDNCQADSLSTFSNKAIELMNSNDNIHFICDKGYDKAFLNFYDPKRNHYAGE